jgi:hypothetical protein
MKMADQVADPAPTLLGVLHVGGQPVREMGQPVRQRVAERRQEAAKTSTAQTDTMATAQPRRRIRHRCSAPPADSGSRR